MITKTDDLSVKHTKIAAAAYDVPGLLLPRQPVERQTQRQSQESVPREGVLGMFLR